MSRGETIRLTRQEAIERFRAGKPALDSVPKSSLERKLRQRGIAKVKLGIARTVFEELSDKYAICIDEHGRWLDKTAGHFDSSGIPEDGHVNKSLKTNTAGMQITDPKNLFHFNDALWERRYEFTHKRVPGEIVDFMVHGFDLQNELAKRAKLLIANIGESYEGLSDLLFPEGLSTTTLRLLRYDGYPIKDDDGKVIVERNAQVAKPHYDRGIATIQAYASDPGFWRQPEGRRGARHKKYYPPHGDGESQLFFGGGFRAIYGSQNNPIQPLYHGVDRIFDENIDYIPARTAVILFVDSPVVDLQMKEYETQPERIDIENLEI